MSIKNRFLAALFKTVLLAGFVHLILLSILTLINPSFSYLNTFSILGVSEFLPGIEKGPMNFIIATSMALVVYFIFYIRSKR